MKPILRSVYPYLFLFFCFVLPLDKYATAVPNLVLIALMIAFPFVVKKDDFKKLYRKEVLIFAGLIVYIAINSLLFQDFMHDQNIIKKMASSVLLLVLFIPLEKTANLKITIIAAVLVCMAICLYNLYFFYLELGEFNFSSGSAINDVLIIDRLYLGFLCVLSIISSTALIGSKYKEYNKWYFANIVLCIGFVLLISSRIAIILLLLLFLLKIFYSKSKKEYLFFFLGVVGLVIIAFMVNKNLNERFFYAHSKQQNKSYIELLKNWEPRFVIWECNYRIAKNEDVYLTGQGFYKTKDQLVDCYNDVVIKEKRRNYFVQKRFNPHNQYIDFLFSTGIAGLLLFLILIFLLFYRNRKSYYKTAFAISIAAFAFIESFMHRQIGAYIFALVIILILYPVFKESNNSSTNVEN